MASIVIVIHDSEDNEWIYDFFLKHKWNKHR